MAQEIKPVPREFLVTWEKNGKEDFHSFILKSYALAHAAGMRQCGAKNVRVRTVRSHSIETRLPDRPCDMCHILVPQYLDWPTEYVCCHCRRDPDWQKKIDPTKPMFRMS